MQYGFALIDKAGDMCGSFYKLYIVECWQALIFLFFMARVSFVGLCRGGRVWLCGGPAFHAGARPTV